MPHDRTSFALPGILLTALFSVAAAAEVPPVKLTTYMVSMADGTKLATDVYLPSVGRPPYPAILARGPYGKGGLRIFAPRLCAKGYAFVSQDMRGRGKSEGNHAVIFHHGGWAKDRDGHDTIRWIERQPWCNGNIGTYGGSALGITQNMLAPHAPRNLKAQFVQVAFSNMYAQCVYQGGVLRKALMEGWLSANKIVEGNLDTFLRHPRYDDFWSELNPEAQASHVNVPAVFLGGWYDIFLQGTINSFVTIQSKGGPRARGNCHLILGPWAHGTFKELKYPPNAGRHPEAADPWRFFDYWLKGVPNGVPRDKPVHYYVMGDPTDKDAPGNQWRTSDNWPPPNTPTPYYFHPDGSLRSAGPPSGYEKKAYTYDPSDPVPTIGGQNLMLPKGPMDQRSVESRPDVLLFTTDKLGAPLEITGPISAKLFLSTDVPDTDVTVKLTDVYPDGRSMLVTDGILRARYRNSFEREEFLLPDRVYELNVDLWSTSLIFNKGHRIRIAVSSSNNPRFEPNPNTGRPGPDGTSPRIAHNTLHFSRAHPSHVLLPVVQPDATSSRQSK